MDVMNLLGLVDGILEGGCSLDSSSDPSSNSLTSSGALDSAFADSSSNAYAHQWSHKIGMVGDTMSSMVSRISSVV